MLWRGYKPITNILYFATPKKSLYSKQIQVIRDLLIAEMPELGA